MNLRNLLIMMLLFWSCSCSWIKNNFESSNGDEPSIHASSSEIRILASNKKFKFIPEEIIAKPGQQLKLKVINQLEDFPIVFSVLKKDEDPVVNAFLGIQSGESNNWWPPDEHLMIKSKTLALNETQSFNITLPNEPGDYSFISSYPGQIDSFHGLIKILDPKNNKDLQALQN